MIPTSRVRNGLLDLLFGAFPRGDFTPKNNIEINASVTAPYERSDSLLIGKKRNNYTRNFWDSALLFCLVCFNISQKYLLQTVLYLLLYSRSKGNDG